MTTCPLSESIGAAGQNQGLLRQDFESAADMSASHFFKLPFEIRRQIYKALYSSITLTYPWHGPPLSGLSRQVWQQSSPVYYKNVRFKFNNTVYLVDFLSSLDHSDLRSVRNVSVRNHPFPLNVRKGIEDYRTRNFASVLALFPGLQLSLLEVRDTYHVPGTDHDGLVCEAAYSGVEDLIEADGFKELRYISDTDCFMMPKEFKVSSYNTDWSTERGLRDPQPSTWDNLIKERDGKRSGAKAEMFRHCGDELVQLTEEFESPPSSEGVVAYLSTPRYRTR
ncbi:MAG: hypothetical protein Q9228_007724 [Teloschistes exilis]